MRSFLFGGSGGGSRLSDLGLLVLRVLAGIGIATHGIGKLPPSEGFVKGVAALGFPMPYFFAVGAGIGEFFGGILLAAGLLTRVGALMMFTVMCVAFFGQHRNDPFARKELAMLYLAISFAFTLIGGGRYSIDRLIRGGRKR
jgi:putative oxidoreductase